MEKFEVSQKDRVVRWGQSSGGVEGHHHLVGWSFGLLVDHRLLGEADCLGGGNRLFVGIRRSLVCWVEG